MTDDRLPIALWVDANIRRCDIENIPVYVIRRGAYFSGTVLLKINLIEHGCKLLTMARNETGQLNWISAFSCELAVEQEIDSYIQRAIQRDPDVWVIEIEDRDGRNPLSDLSSF